MSANLAQQYVGPDARLTLEGPRPDLIDMGRRFFAATGHPATFDAEAFSALLGRMEADPGSVLLTSRKGMLGGSLAPCWCAPTWITAVEFFWWSEDGHGLRLLRRFERWAREMGANEIRMTTLAKLPDAERAMRGYERTETAWTRII